MTAHVVEVFFGPDRINTIFIDLKRIVSYAKKHISTCHTMSRISSSICPLFYATETAIVLAAVPWLAKSP